MMLGITANGPDLASQYDPRLGQAKYLLIVDSESGRIVARTENRGLCLPHEERDAYGQGIAAMRVDALVTGEVSRLALQALKARHVRVYRGAPGTVEKAVQRVAGGRSRALPSPNGSTVLKVSCGCAPSSPIPTPRDNIRYNTGLSQLTDSSSH